MNCMSCPGELYDNLQMERSRAWNTSLVRVRGDRVAGIRVGPKVREGVGGGVGTDVKSAAQENSCYRRIPHKAKTGRELQVISKKVTGRKVGLSQLRCPGCG